MKLKRTTQKNPRGARKKKSTVIPPEILKKNFSDGIIVANAKGQFEDINSSACQLLGYNRRELLKRSWKDLLIGDKSSTALSQPLKKQKKPTTLSSVRVRLKNGDSKTLDIDQHILPDGNLLHIFHESKKSLHDNEFKEGKESFYKMLFELESDAIFIIENSSGKILEANAAACQLYGYTREELLSMKNIDLSLQPDQTHKVTTETPIDQENIVFIPERFHHRRNGEVVAVEITGRFFLYEGRACHIAAMRDITGRKRSEEALQESEKRFRTMFEKHSSVMLLIDPDSGRILDANQSAAEFYGYSIATLRTMNIDEINTLPPAIVRQERKKAMLKEREHFVFSHRIANGEIRTVEVTSSPIISQGKSILFSIIIDITERTQAEEELKKQASYLIGIIENQPGLVWLKDVEGRYFMVNEAFAKSCGLNEPKKVLGKTDLDIWPKELGEKYREDDSRVMRERKPIVIEEPIIDAGEKKWFETYKTPVINSDGKVFGTTGFARDITERRQIFCSITKLSNLKLELLRSSSLSEKLKRITDGIVDIFSADLARIWLIRPSDLCSKGCIHALRTEGPNACKYRERCLHLMTSSGRYESVEGSHRRVPFDAYKIGRIASGKESKFITNNVVNDPNVHDHEWARSLGLVSFAGYKLTSIDGSPMGVLALFCKHKLDSVEEPFLEDLANTTSQVVLSDMSDEALRTSEARYRALIENQNDLISRYRPDTILTFVNDAYCQFYGKTREELIGHSFLSMVAPQFHDLILKETENIVKNPGPINGEYLNYNQKGEMCWINWIIQGINDENGRVVELQAVGRDITERKQAEEALRESEEKFRTFAEQSPNMIFINKMGRVVYVNEKCVEVVKYTKEEFYSPSFNFMDITAPEYCDLVKSMYAKHMEGEYVPPYEYTIITKDGKRLESIITTKIILFEAQPAILGIITDITERKHAEEALRISEERYRTTLYSIGDGVIATDMQGIIQRMNPVAESLTGWQEREACGKKIEDVFQILNEETNERIENPVQVVLEKGSVVGLATHTILISRDGTQRPIADSGAPIRDSAGNATGIVLVFNDQTERKNLQYQLLQAQKMEAIGRLAGGVAHDFNNMIGVILGYATLIEKNLEPSDSSYSKIKSIITAAERSANLTKQLLAFARKQIIAPVLLNLNIELTSIRPMLERLIGEDITLELLLDENLWSIKIDPTQIGQILTNLMTNSRDAIENVGTITIETSNVVFDEAILREHVEFDPGEYVLLAFSDNGKGMDRQTLDRVFEPFFTTKPKGQGTGLGLATVFGIVKQNNGYINVYSEVESGTTFKIYFPRQVGDVDQDTSIEEKITMAGSETILVVEDEEELLNLTTTSLKMHGYNVLSAKSPNEAIAICKQIQSKIDLLISDVIMPEMNGKELKVQLDAIKPGIKVIFMSGYTADIVANRGILEGGIQFLQKPFSPSMLARKVKEALK